MTRYLQIVKQSIIMLTIAVMFFLATSTAQSVPAPNPKVTLDVPAQVLIGETFTFTVKFKNIGTSPGDIGYAPFIDLVLDAGGANLLKGAPCGPDGIRFKSAAMVGVVGGPVNLVHTTIITPYPGTSYYSVPHPFGPSSGILPLSVIQAGEVTTLELPFGSFDPTQPEITIEVTVVFPNKFADLNYPLKIFARGGFRYGIDPLDNAGPPDNDMPIFSNNGADVGGDCTTWENYAETYPQVVIISKKYLGPEGECVTGPNFIDYYPLKYQISIHIAQGQTVTNLTLLDCLPNNEAYHNNLTIVPAASSFGEPPLDVPSADECLKITWNSITEGVDPDPMVTFEFYIPERDLDGNPILPPGDCKPRKSINDIKAFYHWKPLDICDNEGDFASDETPKDHILLDKCIAVQKKVEMYKDVNAPGVTPGDILKYTINFQLSDYKTAIKIRITDVISDGQKISADFPMTLKTRDQFGNLSGDFIENQDVYLRTDNTCDCDVINGGTEIMFEVSEKMHFLASHPRHLDGILTGGYASNPPSQKPAHGTIEFYVEIMDRFDFVQTAGNGSLLKYDPLFNCVTMTCDLLRNKDDPNMPGGVECQIVEDNSKTSLALVGSSPIKSVYAVWRDGQEIWGPNTTTTPAIPLVTVGDVVTFRIEKTIPSSDAANVTVEDWLPLPIFNVDDFDADGTFAQAPNWVFNLTVCGIPAIGSACLFSTDNLSVWLSSLGTPPTLTANPTTNSLKFDYGTFKDPNNTPRKLDLLFTITATSDPFADGLYLTNEAQECESNSLNETVCQTAIAQVEMSEPNVRISKGIVAKSNTIYGIYSHNPPAPVTFQPPGSTSCPRFAGTINSSNLANIPINSNISNVDANDVVTFAIVIENIGTGQYGAFDIKIQDIFPLGPNDQPTCFSPISGSMCVTYGNRDMIPQTAYTISGGWGQFTIEFTDPSLTQGALPMFDPANPATGKNIIIITFDATIVSDIQPGCCDNLATLNHYSNSEGGPDFVSAGFGGPFSDGAEICVKPLVMKKLTSTSENHTHSTTNGEQLTIGEIVRYSLQMIVPESTLPTNYKIQDYLPGGLKFMNGTAQITLVSNGGLSSSYSLVNGPFPPAYITPATLTYGTDPIFDLGVITNLDNDNDNEYIIIEFNAIVGNFFGTQDSPPALASQPNYFGVLAGGNQIATSNVVLAYIVEPNLTITKHAVPSTVTQGDLVTYNIIVTNNGTSDAFDVKFKDILPAGIDYIVGSMIVPGGIITGTGTTLTAEYTILPHGGTSTISYQAYANTTACPNEITVSNLAQITWTSLPGVFGTISNPTGSSTPGNSGAVDGERDGSNMPGSNNYFAVVSAPLIVECPPCVDPLPEDMVGWWPLDELAGATIINDIAPSPGSIFNNIGTPHPGAVGTGPFDGPGPIIGKVDGAMFFPGKKYITVPQQNELNFGRNDFSIDAWVKVAKCGHGFLSPVVDKFDNTTNTGYSLYIDQNPDGNAYIILNVNGNTFTSSTFFNTTIANTWYHIAVTVSVSTGVGTFYINGSSAGNFGPIPLGVSNTVPLWIGETRVITGQGRCEIGIDELELFNRKLEPNEINEIWASDYAGKCKTDLSITKTATTSTPWQVGGSGVFTLEIKNEGQEPILAGTVITVIEYLPAGMTLTSVSSPGNLWSYSPSIPSGGLPGYQTITCIYIVPSDLAHGGAMPLITFNVNITHSGPFHNCADVRGEFAGAILQEPMYNNEDCIDISTGCIPPPPCMLNWWPLDEQAGSGNISHDIRGYSNNGTWINNPNPLVTGKVAGAMFFNGQCYVEVPDHYELNFGTSDFSIDAWVLTRDTSGIQTIIDKRSGTPANPLGYVFYLNHGRLAFQLADGSFTDYVTPGGSAGFIANGQWHLVAVTIDRDNPNGLIFYVDGAPILTYNPVAHNGSLTNNSPLFIGGNVMNPQSHFIGRLDEIEMFCCVLEPADVYGIWGAGGFGKCKPTGVYDRSELPTDYALLQSYPNPFNSSTTIEYQMPVPDFVKLSVMDVLGNEIKVLVNENKEAGNYTVTFDAGDLAAGVYYYTMQTGKFRETRYMILMK